MSTLKEECEALDQIDTKFLNNNFYMNYKHISDLYEQPQIETIKEASVKHQIMLDLFESVSKLKNMNMKKKTIFQQSKKIANVYMESQHILDYISLKTLNKININENNKEKMNKIEEDLFYERFALIWGDDEFDEFKKTVNDIKQKIRTYSFKYVKIYIQNIYNKNVNKQQTIFKKQKQRTNNK